MVIQRIDFRPPSEPPWDVTAYDGGALWKRVRIRQQETIRRIADHVGEQHCVIVLGPHYNEKSRLLHDVRVWLDGQPGFATVYVDLWQARSDDEAAFFSSMQQLIVAGLAPLLVPNLKRSDPESVDARSFQNFLEDLRQNATQQLVFLIDHLQALPHDLIHTLLRSLRAAYMEAPAVNRPRFSVVVTGGMNLADLSHGPTSPFNIAYPVLVANLDQAQSEALVRGHLDDQGISYSDPAVAQILHAAGGDRFLLPRLCAICGEVVAGYQRRQITQPVVEQAFTRLRREEESQLPFRLTVQLIEEDPDTLLDILDLVKNGELVQSQARQPVFRTGANRLLLCGAVKVEKGRYHLLNGYYLAALAEHFTPQRVAHVLRMNGRWDDAIDYLTHQSGPALIQAQSDLLEAIVQSIYAVDGLDEAYAALAKGMRMGFGLTDFRLYRADAVRSELQLVPIDGGIPAAVGAPASDPEGESIDLSLGHRVEVQTFRNSDYALRGRGAQQRLIAALVPEKRPIGLVTVESFRMGGPGQQSHTPAMPQLHELLRFLRHAAGAIENVMLRTALREIGRAVLDASTMTESLRQVLHAVANAIGSDTAGIYLIDDRRQHLELTVHVGQVAAEFGQLLPLGGEHPATRCVAQADKAQEMGARHLSKGLMEREELASRLRYFLPLRARGNCLGVLKLGFEKRRDLHFGSDDFDIWWAFADQVAIAVYNMQLLRRTDEALHSRLLELEKLEDINRAISSSLDLAGVLSRIVSNLQELFTNSEVSVWEFHRDSQHFTTVHTSIVDSDYRAHELGKDSVVGRAVAQGSVLVVTDLNELRSLAARRVAAELGLRTVVVLPLVVRDEVLGAISVYGRNPFPPDPDQRTLLESVAAQAAAAIQNARQYEALLEARLQLESTRERDLYTMASVLVHRLGNATGDIPYQLDRLESYLAEHGLAHGAVQHIRTRVASLQALLPPFQTIVKLGEATFTPTDLREVVHQAVAGSLPCNRCHIRYEMPDLPVLVSAEPGALRDAVQSVVENGCEAMDGQGELHLILGTDLNGQARLTIIDQGPGIDAEIQGRIFDLGFTSKEALTHGRGRGLFTCRAILQKHGGTVILNRSKPGRTEFQIILPRLTESAEAGQPTQRIGSMSQEQSDGRQSQNLNF